MKCIILSAGYRGDSFDISADTPRTLLEITEESTILDAIIEKVSEIKDVDKIFITTNNRYYEKLSTWKKSQSFEKAVELINDTTNNSNEMLGAMGDIEYTINYESIEDDVLVILGDNVFDFSLKPLISSFHKDRNSYIGVMRESEKELLSSVGIIERDEKHKVIGFEEKPVNPKTDVKSLGIYLFPKEILPWIRVYLEEGNLVETPGYFIKYLYKRNPIYAFEFTGNWFDINTPKELSKARYILGGEK